VHYEGLLQSSGETFIKSAEEGRGTGEPAVVVAGRGSVFSSFSLRIFLFSFFLFSLSLFLLFFSVVTKSSPPSPKTSLLVKTQNTDASLRATGLNMAVMAMARGEKARIWIEDPRKFGYGERGSFSFPAVPPLAKLVYDVELVAFEPPDDSDSGADEGVEGGGESARKKNKERRERRPPRSAGSLTYEERLEAATRRKLKGNALLNGTTGKKRDPAAALSQYLFALSYLDDDFLFQLEGPHLEAASSLARAARLNCAAARLALGDARGAAADAGEVLRERPRDAKALFRRGRARRALGDARGAVDDLRKASREVEGRGDPAVARELAAAEAEAGEAARAGDEVMGRALARSVGKGGLFSEEEERKGKGEGSPPPPPLAAFDDGDGRVEDAPRKTEARRGALPAPFLVVVVAAVALAAAAAVARWGGGMMKRERGE